VWGVERSGDRFDARDYGRHVEAAAAPRADAVAPAPQWVMTMHDKWTDQLSDYLDGELTPDERAAVESHLRGCAACTEVLNDLKRVVARAQAIEPRPPQ